MRNFIKIAVAAAALVVAMLVFNNARAETPLQDVDKCAAVTSLKAIGVGALYGAGVGLVATGISVMAAPAGAVVLPVITVVSGAVYGGLIGAGSGASSMLYTMKKTGIDPYRLHCVKEVATRQAERAVEWGKSFM